MTDTTRILVSRILNIGRSPAGVHYSKVELQKLADQINSSDRGVFSTFNQERNDDYTDLSLVAAIINKAHVDNVGLIVEQRILDTPMGAQLGTLMDSEAERAQANPHEEFYSAISITPIVTGRIRQSEIDPAATDLRLNRISIHLIDDK